MIRIQQSLVGLLALRCAGSCEDITISAKVCCLQVFLVYLFIYLFI